MVRPNDPDDDVSFRPRESQHVTALRYFREVARTGSISAASEVLNIASSAISRQITKLELEIGEPLFDRQPRGMSLTPSGRIFYAHALDTLLSLRRTRSEIDELKGLKTGQIRIATIEGLVGSFLSRAVSDFRASFPGVSFSVSITGADDVVDQLQNGRVDIGFAFNAPAAIGIVYSKRIPDPVCALMAPDFPLSRQQTIPLGLLSDQPLAFPAKSFGVRNLIDQAMREQRLILMPVLETNSIEALKAFACNGDGIALLHRYAARRELDEGRLVAIDIQAPILRMGTIDMCVLSGHHLPVAAREFCSFLEKRMLDAAPGLAPKAELQFG